MNDVLTVSEQRDGNVSVVVPDGEVDMQTMRPLRELLRRLPEEGVRYVVLDLREVHFLDSAGMSLLFALKKRLSQDRGECYVVSRDDGFVERTLRTIDIGRVMPHLHSLEEALESVREKQAGSRPAVAAS